MSSIKNILNLILSKNIFEYIVIDLDINIVFASSGVQKYFDNMPQKSDDVLDYFPELIGIEDVIKKICLKEHPEYSLSTIYKNEFYINIFIEHFGKNRAVILLHDITAITNVNQEFLQHGNEVTLLYNNLKKVSRSQNLIISQQSKLSNMGQMINSIAHQWRQPLNQISSNIAVVHEIIHSKKLNYDMIESKMNNIQNHIIYMSNTIKDFVHFFHPDKKKELFVIDKAVHTILKLMEARLNGISIVITPDTNLTINSYKSEFYQVLLSILNNAVDNFEIKKVKNPNIDIIIKNGNEMITIIIQDNGGGIDGEYINRIFEPYYTTKSSYEGTGLGLHIAKMITEKSFKGSITVKNTQHGACFEIKITKNIL